MNSIPIDPSEPTEKQVESVARLLCEQEFGTDRVDEVGPTGDPRWYEFKHRAAEIVVERNGQLNRF